MSHARAALHCKVRALRRTRDQLEPMVHSGPADAEELWEELEKRWRNLESQLKHLTRGNEEMVDGVADMVRHNVTELRKGYDRLASALREPRSDSLCGPRSETPSTGSLTEASGPPSASRAPSRMWQTPPRFES